MRIKYSICAFVAASALAALFFMEQVSVALFVLLVEVIAVFMCVELLSERMPTQLQTASEDNCFRIDGSFSFNRAARENHARKKVKLDLLAVFLFVVLTSTWLACCVNSLIIPWPIAVKAAQAFDLDQPTWQQNLHDSRVNEAHEQWMARNGMFDREAVKSQQRWLWQFWPVMMFLGIMWLMGCGAFLMQAYAKILREFETGISARTQSYLNGDIRRMQASCYLDTGFQANLASNTRMEK